MPTKRTVEVFSAGCRVCQDTIELVERIACPSCEVRVLDMNDRAIADRARALGILTVPAVVVDGELAGCCRGAGPSEQALREAGIGRRL